jgi:hypothetical protein
MSLIELCIVYVNMCLFSPCISLSTSLLSTFPSSCTALIQTTARIRCRIVLIKKLCLTWKCVHCGRRLCKSEHRCATKTCTDEIGKQLYNRN